MSRWRRTIVRTALVTVVTTGGVACTADKAERAAPPSPAEESTTDACAGVRAQAACRSITLSDGRVVRYAVVRPSTTAEGDLTQGTVMDLGGPGVALFGADWPGEALQAVTDRLGTPVVILDEPWTRTPYPAGCRQAARAWYETLHSGSSSSGAELADACDLGKGLWGWTPAAYDEAMQAALEQEGLTFERFVGASFAGVRLGYLSRQPDEVVLVSPYPSEQSATEYLTTRLEAVQAFCSAAPAGETCRGQVPTGEAAKRSIEVTPFDVGAAWLGTNYQRRPVAFKKMMADEPTAEVLGALSDAVTGRFGVTDVSPATFAYFDEACASFAPWEPEVTSRLAAATFLQQWHAVCAQVDPAPGPTSTAAPAADQVCVVSYRGDAVVPSGRSQKSWRGRADQRRVLPGVNHGVIDTGALDACT